MSEALFPGVLSRLTSRSALEQVIGTPGYAAAAWRALRLEVDQRRADAAFVKASDDIGLYVALALAVHLHQTPDGLTHARLTRALEFADIASRGRARKILRYLLGVGYLVAALRREGQREDRREQRYLPTPALTERLGTHYRMILDAAAPLMPSAGLALSAMADARFFGLFTAVQGEAMMWSALQMRDETDLTLAFFSDRTGGMSILAHVLLSGGETGDFPSVSPLEISISRIARECGVSRPHVRKLLEDAVTVGFLSRDREGRLNATPLLLDHARLWMALRFCFADLVAGEALRRFADERAMETGASGRPQGMAKGGEFGREMA